MTAKQRPSEEQLSNLLKTPHFGQGGSLPQADPICPTPMVLTLEQIRKYEHNPRHERNPCYDEIKDSIRERRGLNNPLTVTRRPGDEHFILDAGGNTRLDILQELYNETGDDAFFRLLVTFHPWQSESHVLSAHLIENEKRGDMIFIDKALAITELKTMFEKEGSGSYTLRAMAQRLREVGYSVDYSFLSRMNYAVEFLLPLIPTALRAGIGRPQITRIRQIENAFKSYWIDHAGQHESDFISLFEECLVVVDNPEWDSDTLIRQLEKRVAELLNIPEISIRQHIDALLHGTESEFPLSQPVRTSGDDSDNTTTSGDQAYRDSQSDVSETLPFTQSDITDPLQLEQIGTEQALSNPDDDNRTSDDEETTPVEKSPFDIKRARKTIYNAASRLATRYQLEQCILPSSNWGLGFLVDLPNEPLIPDNTQSETTDPLQPETQRQWIWWLLYICSEETAQSERINNLPKSMAVRHLYVDHDHPPRFQFTGQPSLELLNDQLLANPLFPDQDFEFLITLIRQCRQLRTKMDTNNNRPLWEPGGQYAQA
ncbi:MAG: hypothetical protein OEZ39_14195 [Gammaproteobacteria bacterium]|nr:hypothetical protein [Gammaproteobacteria bacterium]MDH5653003.1 hypothetical protein [Gammaproteobacteria bacterium]